MKNMLPFNKKLIAAALILNISASPIVASAAQFSVGGVRLNKKVKTMREIQKKDVVMQSTQLSCGAAALSTILTHFLDDNITERQIIATLLKYIPIEKVQKQKGFSLLALKKFAEALGHKVTGYKMDMNHLAELEVPVIVPVAFRNYNHFVVVKGVIGERVFIADPVAGNLTLMKDKFQQIWAGGAVLVIENKEYENISRDYALRINEDDLILADYKSIRRIISQDVIRTAIYPNEW